MKKFYIIEDDVYYAFSMKAKLSAGGFRTEIIPASASSDEIIIDIKKYLPDFIILEPSLYGIDGMKLLYDIRKGEGALRAPVFVYTNNQDSGLKEKIDSCGVEYFFIKDELIIDDFIEKINKILLNREKTIM